MTERSAVEIKADLDETRQRITELTNERNALPRNDKARAHELLNSINSLSARVRNLRPEYSAALKIEQAQERHGMWVDAVAELYGKAAVDECFAWMRRKRSEEKQRKRSIRPVQSEYDGNAISAASLKG